MMDNSSDTLGETIVTDKYIEEMVHRYAADKYIVGFESFYEEFFDDFREQMIDLVMRCDYVELVDVFFLPNQIHSWCEKNAVHVIEKCPKLLEAWWNASPKHMPVEVAKILELQSDADKECILRDGGATRPGQILHAFIKSDVKTWERLSPLWLGAADSGLREAARGAGWRESNAPQMIAKNWRMSAQPAWLNTVHYPFSLAAYFFLAQSKVPTRKARSFIAPPKKIMPTIDSNPQDLVLAKRILEYTALRCVWKEPKGMPVLDIEQQKTLQGLVDMHTSLDTMPILLDALINNTLVHSQHQQRYELPDLDLSD